MLSLVDYKRRKRANRRMAIVVVGYVCVKSRDLEERDSQSCFRTLREVLYTDCFPSFLILVT
jgi:hypothetical protein